MQIEVFSCIIQSHRQTKTLWKFGKIVLSVYEVKFDDIIQRQNHVCHKKAIIYNDKTMYITKILTFLLNKKKTNSIHFWYIAINIISLIYSAYLPSILYVNINLNFLLFGFFLIQRQNHVSPHYFEIFDGSNRCFSG